MSEKKYTILVVEDEASLAKALTDTLSKRNYHVLSAANGKDGLDMALAKKPDLILLDIVMPVMDGISMLQKLREDAWGKDVSVIVLSNLNDQETVTESLAGGAYDYMVKTDWSPYQIVARIQEKLSHTSDT